MAATGLLGINPYQKGVAIDISSKPINLAIQLEQKERAKQEALDKYLMDYEKTLNPNGMRQQDQNAFLSKLGEAKQYYLQNRDKILNPAKYGAEYQSTYYAGLRNAQSLIGQSKQAAAQDKITAQHFIAQKDLNAPDGYADALAASHLPIDQGYRPLDITQFKFYKSYNPMEYANKIYSKIPLSEGAPVDYYVQGKPGRYYTKTISKIDSQYKDAIYQQGYIDYANDEGLRKEMNRTFDTNKAEVSRLEKKYETKIPNAQALAAVHLWDLQPVKENTSDIRVSPEYTSQLIAGRSGNKPLTPAAAAVKFLQGGVTALQTSDANVINDYFKPFKSQTKTSTKGEVIGFENIEILPEGKVKVNYSIPINSGGVTIKRNTNRIIDTKSPSLLQELTALYQEFLGSNVGAEAGAISNDGSKPSSGKSYQGLDKNGNPIYR